MRSEATRVRTALRALTLAVALAAPAIRAQGVQVRFDVPEPFRVGSHEFASGTITVHSVSAYSPTTSILEVWVNGGCLGMMTAHRSVSEEPPGRNEALFRRDDDGRLVMIGYRMTGRPTGTTYRFEETQGATVPGSAPTVALGTH